jgi:ABC-type transporter Mla MlaB component
MATNDNFSLLTRVVNFVSGPVARKTASEGAAQVAQDSADKATIQAMIDRKQHNDVVRKREFELLRQMRKREPQSNRIDLHERTSMFATSILTPASGRAQTIKKIDEIEQQMSQQWWKGKQIKGSFHGSKPQPLSALATETSEPVAAAKVPVPVPAAVTPPPVAAARLEASLYDSAPSTPAEFMPTQVNQFAHDPAIEAAAILFANGDYEGAGRSLLALLTGSDVHGELEQVWMSLFDLYRVTGDRTRFDGAAIDYAARRGRSAPQWGSSQEIAQAQVADITMQPAGNGSDWTAPAELGLSELDRLNSVLAMGGASWHMNWSALTTVESKMLPELVRLFSEWAACSLRICFVGAEHLDDLLRNATPRGNAEVSRDWWLWRLAALRLAHREDDFEIAALDYCITYEMSPPAWEPPRCDYSSRVTDKAQEALDSLIIGEDLVSTLPAAFSVTNMGTATDLETATAGLAATENSFELVALSGEMHGDAAAALAKLDEGRIGCDKLVVDCRQLMRVDFAAAGSLLNWTSACTAEGCQVEFKNVNRLVATFFSVVGIDEFARITAYSP